MNRLAILLCLGFFACAKTTPGAAGIGEPCVLNGDCANGFLCASGRCALPANLGGCEPAALRCNGSDVEKCNDAGLGWENVTTCTTGCSAGACRPQACNPGQRRCEGDTAEACSPAGDAWTFVQQCATHCDTDTGRCKAPACAPFSSRCAPDGSAAVWVCDAYGSGYVTTACQPNEECQGGACAPASAGCTAGDVRCNGREAQACVAGAPGTTKWQTRESCALSCSGGLCQGGVGCAAVTLHAAVTSAPADGVSTVLFYSDPVVSAAGLPLPDGQEFTVSASAAAAGSPDLTDSTDADPSLSGVQVLSAGGRVHFTVHAPAPGSADVPVTATARLSSAGNCGGRATLTFGSAPFGGVLVAEDFTSGGSTVNGGTDWNTTRGELLATFPFPTGDGRDGPLEVGTGSTLDIAALGLAPAYPVVSLGSAGARLGGVLGSADLQGGDEVLLWDAQGSASGSANAGSFESLVVASVSGDQVTFTTPVRGYYGAAGDQAVNTQRVVLQRVPQLASLTVQPGGVLTTSAWDGQKGGLLFVRVAGAAVIRGDVDLDGKGYRAAASQSAPGEDGLDGVLAGGGGGLGAGGGGYGTAGVGAGSGTSYGSSSLSTLFLGSGGGCTVASCPVDGGRGGGAAVIFARTLSLQAAAPNTNWQGSVHANGVTAAGTGGGSGGSIWLAASSVVLGDGSVGVIKAAGKGNGGLGRVRLDYLSTDVNGVGTGGADCSRSAPACALGQHGPLVAQSSDAYLISGGTTDIHQVKLEAALGSPAGAIYRASTWAGDPPDFSAPLAIGDTATFGTDTGMPKLGKRFRWRAELSPTPGTTQTLLGLQWSLKIY